MEGDVGVFAVWERAMHLIQDLLFVFHHHLKPLGTIISIRELV